MLGKRKGARGAPELRIFKAQENQRFSGKYFWS